MKSQGKDKFNNTNYLIEDSFAISNIKNTQTQSYINSKFNNTQNLINDKTSFFIENTLKETQNNYNNRIEELEDEPYLRTSFILDDKILSTSHNEENKYRDNSLLSLSDDSDKIETSYKLSDKHSDKISDNLINKINIKISDLSIKNNSHFFNKNILIDFNICFPDEIVKKSIILKNEDIFKNKNIIKFKFSEENNIKEYFTQFDVSNLKIDNSIKKYKCFFINNHNFNENNELILEVYLRTPFIKVKEDLFNVIQIYKNNENITNICLYAKIEIPKLLCLKQTNINENSLPLISIMLEVTTKGQKFRIPFKNLSIKEMTIEFTLDQKNNNSIFLYNNNYYECQFLFFPNEMNIDSMNTNSIDIIAKIKRIKFDENLNQSKINEKVRKIIIAEIKNTKIIYNFFIEGHFKK